MTNQEKALKVIQLYDEGLDAEEIALKVGYSHPKSLSRFMRGMNYKWDNHIKNYAIADNLTKSDKSQSKAIEKQKVETKVDPLDLLEDPTVLSALQQSDVILNLIELQKLRESKKHENKGKTTYSFWKKAQEFAFTRKASFTTSVRLPVELNERLNNFRDNTNLTQTQIICMALDYFIERFESRVT